MSKPTPTNEPHDELAQLQVRMEQGQLSPAETERLNALLRSDEAARERFVQQRSVEALLAWRFASPAAAPAATPWLVAMPAQPAPQLAPRRSRTSLRGWMLAAAALLIGVVVGYPLGAVTQPKATDSKVASNAPAAAVLTLAGPDVRWAGERSWAAGAGIEKGWLHLEAGIIELTFSSGATVRLEGPALFAVDSPLRGYLSYGRIRVRAPESARDFSVGTASMEVVDLGTEFDLAVSQQSGAAEIAVREGLVDLHLSNAGGASRIQSLSTGQSAAVDESGKITAIQGKKLDPLLLAHWPLDDDADSPLVRDASPNGFHGTFHLATHERGRSGKAGRALALGSDGYVDFSQHLAALTRTSAFTLAAWVRNADDIVFSVSDGTQRQRLQFELHGPWLYYGWQQGDRFDRIQAGVSGWEPDVWRHVAVSVSGGAVTIYRDGRALIEPRRMGAALNTRAIAPIDLENPTAAYLGRLPSNHADQPQWLGGELDDVQLYGRALDEVAIRYLFEHPGSTLPAGLP